MLGLEGPESDQSGYVKIACQLLRCSQMVMSLILPPLQHIMNNHPKPAVHQQAATTTAAMIAPTTIVSFVVTPPMDTPLAAAPSKFE